MNDDPLARARAIIRAAYPRLSQQPGARIEIREFWQWDKTQECYHHTWRACLTLLGEDAVNRAER